MIERLGFISERSDIQIHITFKLNKKVEMLYLNFNIFFFIIKELSLLTNEFVSIREKFGIYCIFKWKKLMFDFF